MSAVSAVLWPAAAVALVLALVPAAREVRRYVKWERAQREQAAERGRKALRAVADVERLPAVPYGTVADEAERICKEAAGG